jgi:LAO/AO transport system kinase
LARKPTKGEYQNYLKRMFLGEKLALAKLVTLVENGSRHVPEIMEKAFPLTGRCLSLGVTGPPGAGKSTLVDQLIARMRRQDLTVGVIAIDPSSPFSGGAVLGDRIRMQRHALDEGVFIRSFSTRGSHGGLSRATGDVLRLFDAFGMDVVIIETVGVGQTELDVMNIADTTLVVLVPESGDTVQTMKAGLMEIADLFIVNKADRDGAQRMEMQLQSMVEMSNVAETGWKIPVLQCQALRDKGIDAVETAISEHKVYREASPDQGLRKRKTRRMQFLDILYYRFQKSLELMEKEDHGFQRRIEQVQEESSNPYQAANQLFGDQEFLKRLFHEDDGSAGGLAGDPERGPDE